jgi:hypothetical protein
MNDTFSLEEAIMKLNIQRAFDYPRRDPEWVKKVLIGSLVSIVPILNFAIGGYFIKIIRNVSQGEDERLPEWDDWGTLFTKGLMLVLIFMVYSIPMFVLTGGVVMMMIAGGALAGGMDKHGGENLIPIMMAGPMLLYVIVMLFAIALALISPAVMARYAMSEDFKDAFNFKEIYQFIRANIGDYIIMLLLAYLASTVASFGIIFCFVGMFVLNMYAYLFMAHMIGQMTSSTWQE